MRIQQYVVGLEVAVDDALGVQADEALRDAVAHLQHLQVVELPPGLVDQPAERVVLQKLVEDDGARVVEHVLVHRDDAVVALHQRQRLHLVHKALVLAAVQLVLVAVGDHLDGDVQHLCAPQQRSAVHDPIAAAAQQLVFEHHRPGDVLHARKVQRVHPGRAVDQPARRVRDRADGGLGAVAGAAHRGSHDRAVPVARLAAGLLGVAPQGRG
mmetsp:Transcript_24685/g.63235  ORF Transcript_24685/g.63235 Transcript_24685/m.63235 type:complete len:212 (-) Transcript_24685:1906-2541(-)